MYKLHPRELVCKSQMLFHFYHFVKRETVHILLLQYNEYEVYLRDIKFFSHFSTLKLEDFFRSMMTVRPSRVRTSFGIMLENEKGFFYHMQSAFQNRVMFGKLLFHRELLPRPLESEAVIEREIVCIRNFF